MAVSIYIEEFVDVSRSGDSNMEEFEETLGINIVIEEMNYMIYQL